MILQVKVMIKRQKPSKRVYNRQLLSKEKQESISILSTQLMLELPELSYVQIQDLHVLGSLQNKFILVGSKTNASLYLLDQHAVHQRIRYQYFTALYQSLFSSQQHQILSISESMKSIISTNKSSLNYRPEKVKIKVGKQVKSNWGFVFQQINGSFYLVQVPVVFNRSFLLQHMDSILADLQQSEYPKQLDNLIRESSCKGALKFGDKIDLGMANKMLNLLSRCKYPFMCIHGRNLIHWITKTKKSNLQH